MKLYVFGNEYLPGDSFASEVSKHLKVDTIKCKSPDDLLEVEGDVWILDVIKNVKEPVLVEDISKFKVNSLVSMHDFDLAYFLNLMKELGMAKSIKIIGIPANGDATKVAGVVDKWLTEASGLS